jgi:hypothetical protein
MTEIHNINDNMITHILFNPGIKCFGKDQVISIIHSFYDTYNLPIISIGTGCGAIEYCSIRNKDINWICIDKKSNPIEYPYNAKYYINKSLMNIDYNSIDELIHINSNIVNNCILFLNWCDPNDSVYDYEAIIKLKPRAILSIYEVFLDSNGSAGGKQFYNWTINNDDYITKEEYKLIPYYNTQYNNYEDDVIDIRISWFQHINDDIDDKKIIYIDSKCSYPKLSSYCSIM